MPYKSVKDWFAAHNGARVVKFVSGVATIEDWPAIVADYRRQLLAQNCPADKITENESGLHWPGGFVLRPKFRREECGLLNVRSADYSFTPEGRKEPVYGDKKGAKVEGLALVKAYPNGLVVRFEKAAVDGE